MALFRSEFGKYVALLPANHDSLSQDEMEFVQMGCPVIVPAKAAAKRTTVSFSEGRERGENGKIKTLELRKQLPRPGESRCAGEKNRSTSTLQKRNEMLSSLGIWVFEVMAFVGNDHL